MCFDLVHDWNNLGVSEKGGQGLDTEIGNTDIFNLSCNSSGQYLKT